MPPRAILVWLYLHKLSNKESQCWPSQNRIARETHLSRSTVKRAIRDLEHRGWLKTEQRWREDGTASSLLYTLRE